MSRPRPPLVQRPFKGLRDVTPRVGHRPDRTVDRAVDVAGGDPPALRVASPMPLARTRLGSSPSARFVDLVDAPDRIAGRRHDTPAKTLAALERGHAGSLRTLDLHGHRTAEACRRLATFLRTAVREDERLVRIIHGKGRHSPAGHSLLRREMLEWLTSSPNAGRVRAFASEVEPDGASGALLVLLDVGGESHG